MKDDMVYVGHVFDFANVISSMVEEIRRQTETLVLITVVEALRTVTATENNHDGNENQTTGYNFS